MKITKSFRKISKLRHRIKAIQGSQGASKTYSILQRWILLSSILPTKEVCSIITDTMPALRAGAIKDFENICNNEGIPFYRTKSPYIFKVNGWTFEFYSVDKESKGRGGRRDRLFINEANRMPWRIAQQLISRTHIEVIVDFNPVEKFWIHENFVDHGLCDFIKLTYKDNEMLPQAEVEAIERHAPWGAVPDANYWRVFGLGEIGFVEGQIYKNYKKYKELPEGDYQECIGVDYGDVDPMAAVHVSVDHTNRRIYWKQLFYSTEANIDTLIDAIKNQVPNWADIPLSCEHEPKLNRMLRSEGLHAYKANKKAGIPADIRAIKQYELYIYEGSEDMIYEADNYKYQLKGDHFIDYPDQSCEEHALDAARYGSIFCIGRD